MCYFISGYKLWLTGIVICFAFAGCDSPSGSFERLNTSDPGSVLFEGEKDGDYDLKLEFDSERNMMLSWGKLEDFIDKVVIKKSLGDSLSYQTVAEIESPVAQWQDTSGAIARFFYYKIETYYNRNGVDYKYGEASLKEQLGEFLDFSFELNNENESLDIKWEVDTSFFDSFVLESDHMITENGDKRVELPFSTLETVISIKDPDLTFSLRKFTLTGVIAGGNGQDDIIVKRELTADLKSAYKPQNLKLDIIDEQDWLLSWEGAPYFADKVVVRRNGYNGNWFEREFQPSKESLLDTVLAVQEYPLVNENRRYQLVFKDGTTISDSSYVDDWIELTSPELIEVVAENPSSQSVTIGWEIGGFDVDKIKEFRIEKRTDDEFEEVGRVSGDKRRFTYDDLDITKQPMFRVKSLTSGYSPPKTYQYVNDYSRVKTLNTNSNEFVTTQITSDNQYFSGLSEDGITHEIWDLDSGEKVYDYNSELGLVSDFKISHDNQYMYYVIPEMSSVFRADFPTGNNVIEVIEDAVFSNVFSELDGYPVRKIDLSSDGEYILGVGANYVKRWSLDSFEIDFTKNYESVDFFYNQHIDISNDDQTFVISASGAILLLNTDDGSIIRQFESGDYVTEIGFSPQNNFIYSKSGNNTYIYRPETGDTYKRYTGLSVIDFDPDNDNTLVMGEVKNNYPYPGRYFEIYFYDLEKEKQLGILSDKHLNSPGFFARYISYIDSDRLIIGFSGEEDTLEIWEQEESKQWKMK